jgi:UPF0755 protein
MWMSKALVVLVLLGIAVFALWIAPGALGWRADSRGPATVDTRVSIPAGSSLRAALGLLAKLGVLRQPRLLEIYLRCCEARFAQRRPAIKAGDYLLPAGASAVAIVQQLDEGRVVLEQLTVVEGWSFAQMRSALDAHPHVAHVLQGRSDREVMAALGFPAEHPEGRFFPDTLRFAAGTSDQQILGLAHATLARELEAAWNARAADIAVGTPAEALVLASIIEKETGLPAERRRIAGVFTNRLRIGMRLQSDPTVIYGIGARYDGDIRSKDLSTDTPYNTYTRNGLPPTPIALPGRDSIWAAVQPDKTDALYFVATGDGSGAHHFSATLEEHNAAVRSYLARLRSGKPR